MVKYTVRLPTGNEYGPADLATLRTWKAEGRIGADSWVWTEGAPEWLPLEAVLAAGTDPPAASAPKAPRPTGTPGQPAGAPRREGAGKPAVAKPRGAVASPAPAGPAKAPAAAPGGPARSKPAATQAARAPARPKGAPGSGAAGPPAAPAASAKPPGAGRSGAASRPRPPQARASRPAPAAASGGTRWMVLAGVGLLALLVIGGAARLFLLPAIESWRAASRLQGEAAAEDRFADPAGGLLLEPPGDWLLLKPSSSLLVAPLATARLAHATTGGRATLTARRQPPGLAPLDAFLDEIVGERRALVEGYAETGRADAVLDGRPARRLTATWSEGGVAQKAIAVATRDAWLYVALLAWGPAAEGDDLDAAFEGLFSALDVAGALEQQIARQATGLLRSFPELSRPSVELLLRLEGDEPTDEARLAVRMAETAGQGVPNLGPDETRKLREIYSRVFEPLSDADRERLAAWQQAVRAGQPPAAAETRAVREAVRASLRRLPGETLVALQALNQQAIFAGAQGR